MLYGRRARRARPGCTFKGVEAPQPLQAGQISSSSCAREWSSTSIGILKRVPGKAVEKDTCAPALTGARSRFPPHGGRREGDVEQGDGHQRV